MTLPNKSKIGHTKLVGILLLVLFFSSSIAILPITNAHSPAWTIPTYCFVNVRSFSIGINQPQYVVAWVQDPPPTADGNYGDRWSFTFDITKPDGTKQTLGPISSDN